MRLIDADSLKADLKQYFTDGVLDGVSAKVAFNQILHDIDNASTIARTDKPLAIINDKVAYITEGHINALIRYEEEKYINDACNRIINGIKEIQEWENNNG